MNTARPLDCDLLVIGGGCAGFAAALSGARQGLKVRLIEQSHKIGGVMAACPGMPWGGGFPQARTVGGVFAELCDALFSKQPPAAEIRPCTLENFGHELIYDHEMATYVMFDMLEQAGVTVHLATIATQPHRGERNIQSVECVDRAGHHRIHCRQLIDASGDGEVSARAGLPYTVGDNRGAMMAVTLSFHMLGVDIERAFADGDPYFEKYAAKGIAAGQLHPDLAKLYLMRGFHNGDVFCNSVAIRGVDGTDPAAVAKATQEGRRRIIQLASFLRQSVPGFEQAQMREIGPMVGVRETRHFEAMYRLTHDDCATGRKFADGIVACDNPVDDVMRGDGAMTHDAAVQHGDYFTLPFRALVPTALDNVLFAGRLISADPTAFASIRGMPQCMIMGQAAGIAAAQALAHQHPNQQFDTVQLIKTLTQQGVNRLHCPKDHAA
ncbi:MAG: FAD-dependent oxidoreductase [Gammaproteobacteria bacterium]|nr:FAD-dependent oxidoreductase [Gammaproteobacteria bacterium]